MGFARIIIEWYQGNKRPLPWRETKDPYKIWVSEVILQQTRVNQGLDYYYRFLDLFPDVHALAGASEEQVLKAWQGLGYYSRARNMHKAAQTIVERHSGSFPAAYRELLELKGVGEYTASAVASIAFNLPCPVIDGNVLRFMSRYLGILEPVNSSGVKKKILDFLSGEINNAEPGTFNQAVMELGALVCTPRNPACPLCPLQDKCLARNTGSVDKIPIKEKKPLPRPRYFHYLVIILRDNNQIFTLLNKRSGKDIWRNLFEFPMIETHALPPWEGLNEEPGFKAMFSVEPVLVDVTRDFRHILSHRVLNARCFLVETERPPRDFARVRMDEINDYPLPRLMEKILEETNITFYV